MSHTRRLDARAGSRGVPSPSRRDRAQLSRAYQLVWATAGPVEGLNAREAPLQPGRCIDPILGVTKAERGALDGTPDRASLLRVPYRRSTATHSV